MAHARQLAGSGWVLLAELDPRGGDLLERLALGRSPRVRFDNDLPPGAQQLAEHLASLEFAGGLGEDSLTVRPVLAEHLVEVAGVAGLRVLLGDHLVDGATRAAAVITPWLSTLAERAGAEAIVIDGGAWTSAQPERVAVASIIQASSASQNARCMAELSALWRVLESREQPGRLVGVVVDPVHDADELRELFEGGTDRSLGRRSYRVVVLAGRGERATLARLAAGQWRGISDEALGSFLNLASPIGDRTVASRGMEPGPVALVEPVVDEHAYLAPTVQADSGVEAPANATHEAGMVEGIAPDPGFWPFDDGEVLIVDDAQSWGPGPEVAPAPSERAADERPSTDGAGKGSARSLPPRPTHRGTAIDDRGDTAAAEVGCW